MDVLALKWNNHMNIFSHQISELRKKTLYADATIACDGKLYNVHRFVLSICSEYFNFIFMNTSCNNPVIIMKDICGKDIEYLLDFMYTGVVNVRQNELATLISAAETLQIKGLAVSDDSLLPPSSSYRYKKSNEFINSSDKEYIKLRKGDPVDSKKYDENTLLNTKKKVTENSSVRSVENGSTSDRIVERNNISDKLSTNLIKNNKENNSNNIYDADDETEEPKKKKLTDLKENHMSSLLLKEQIKCELPEDSLGLYNFEDQLNQTASFCSPVENSDSVFLESSNTSEDAFGTDLSSVLLENSGYSPTKHLAPTSVSSDTTVDTGFLSSRIMESSLNLQKEEFRLPSEENVMLSSFSQLSDQSGMITNFQNNLLHYNGKIRLKRNRGSEDTRNEIIGSPKRYRCYACKFCGRNFSHRTNQIAHERIHTGEKPFHCIYCSFKTALKGNLKNHIYSRHSADWKAIKHLITPEPTKVLSPTGNE